jgi:hypothetical protein
VHSEERAPHCGIQAGECTERDIPASQLLLESEAELDAARTRAALNSRARKFQRAKVELQRPDNERTERPKRRSTRAPVANNGRPRQPEIELYQALGSRATPERNA